MATGGADVIAPLLEELLTCDVCQEEFHSTKRPPRILPCYHSYCGQCLQKLTQHGKVKCPKCRQEAAADKPFQMDTVRVSVMDWKQSVLSVEGKACEGCPVGAKATSKCLDCDEHFCSDCTDYHRRFKMSKDHTLISLSEAAKSPEKLLQTLSEKCHRHPDKNLELFCLTCDKAVCSVCALTQHLKGHEFVELSQVLEDVKSKILAVCQQLDKAQEGFQKKAEQSEASLQILQCNHREAEKEVKDSFSSVVSIAMERQAEVLEELTAKVKSERLRLEDQVDKFRSLQAATQSAAGYGRKLVSITLTSEAKKASADLERTAADLKKKLTTPVAAAATFQVGTEKVEELRALLKSLGKIDTETAAAAVTDLPVVFPDITLDGSRCHGDCTVSDDGCSLTNQPHPPSPSQSQQKFSFRGTCGTVALPGQTCYWQVHVKALPSPQIAERGLCECGVSSMQDLQAAGVDIDGAGRHALTVVLIPTQGRVQALVYHCGTLLTATMLVPFNPRSRVERTLGFLLDVQRKRLAILDVDGRQVLCEREVAMSQPLWPCVSVYHPARVTRASVCVRVESGEHVTLTPEVVGLIQKLLG